MRPAVRPRPVSQPAVDVPAGEVLLRAYRAGAESPHKRHKAWKGRSAREHGRLSVFVAGACSSATRARLLSGSLAGSVGFLSLPAHLLPCYVVDDQDRPLSCAPVDGGQPCRWLLTLEPAALQTLHGHRNILLWAEGGETGRPVPDDVLDAAAGLLASCSEVAELGG